MVLPSPLAHSAPKSFGCALSAPVYFPVKSVGGKYRAEGLAQTWPLQRLPHGGTPLFILRWGRWAQAESFKAQPFRGFDSDSYLTGAAGKNLYHHLESYTQTHTPNPHLYRGEHDTDISSHVFFTSPYQPLLDFALSNEKWALKPWSLLCDLPRTLLPHELSGCSQPQESEGGKEKIING